VSKKKERHEKWALIRSRKGTRKKKTFRPMEIDCNQVTKGEGRERKRNPQERLYEGQRKIEKGEKSKNVRQVLG